ncbi:MAG: glycosyltransferase [Chitinophagales bacterium]|nr:glycosyltransferase [Chitinophagales bacterium]
MLLNRVPYPLNDGGAIGAYNFIKGYADAGCDVTILTMNTARHYVESDKIKEVLGGFGKGHAVYVDNRIKPLGAIKNLFTGKSYITERFVSQEFKDALIRLLTGTKYDVVHIDGIPPANYISVVREHAKAKVSMRAHNVEYMIWKRIAENENNPVKKWYLKLQSERLAAFERKVWQQCDLVMAISREDEATILNDVPEAKTAIVPAGMDIPRQPLNTNFNPLDLCFIGAMDWMPNIQGMEWFVEKVLPVLQAEFPKIKVAVAGKKTPDSFMALESENLLPVGEVPDAKEFMLQHGLMIVPIVSGSGIRIKILEGMALGKTVLATTMAAEGLGLSNGETILIADTPKEFSEQIKRCINDASLAKKIGTNAHRFAYEHYRNKSIFEKLIARYRKL